MSDHRALGAIERDRKRRNGGGRYRRPHGPSGGMKAREDEGFERTLTMC